MPQGLSVVIPSWNGHHLLAQNLPSVVDACRQWGGAWEMIIVDDGSDDETLTRLPQQFPAARVISMGTNRGFQAACNRGVAASRHPVILLLNNDTRLTPRCLAPVLQHFNDPSVFAVSLGVRRSPEDPLDPARILFRGAFHHGLIASPIAVMAEPPPAPSESFCFDGGCCAFVREMFLALGGFDELFSPMYGEDRDLAYRAWKRGWRLLHEPRSLAYHPRGQSARRRYDRRTLAIIAERNKYLLVWKTVSDQWLLARHVVFVGLRLTRSLLCADGIAWAALWGALARWPEVRRARAAERSHIRLTDGDLFRRFRPPHGARLVWFTDKPGR